MNLRFNIIIFLVLLSKFLLSQEIKVLGVSGEVYMQEVNRLVKVHDNDNISGKRIEIRDNSFLIFKKKNVHHIIKNPGVFMADTIKEGIKKKKPANYFKMLYDQEDVESPKINGMSFGMGASVDRGDEDYPKFYNGHDIRLLPNAAFILVWPNLKKEQYKVTFYDKKANKLILDSVVTDTVFYCEYQLIKDCEWCEVGLDLEHFEYANMYFDKIEDSTLATQNQVNKLISQEPMYNYMLAIWYKELKYYNNMLAYLYKSMLAFPKEKFFKNSWEMNFK